MHLSREMARDIFGDLGHSISHLGVGSLGTAAATRSTSTAVLSREVAPGAALSAGAVAIETTTAALSASTATAVVTTAVGSRLGTTLLDDDLLAVDHMGVRVQSSVVSLGSLVLDKSAVLDNR